MNVSNVKWIGVILLSVVMKLAQAQAEFSIAFGSCAHQNRELPVFNTIANYEPNLFVFLGDNIYADTEDMAVMWQKYQQLNNNPNFQKLKASTPIIATWDDHDYGVNDGGKHYPKKIESKALFLDFFNEPAKSERRKHTGVYASYTYKFKGKIIQVILLDTRTFRDTPKRFVDSVHTNPFDYGISFIPSLDSTKTMLGKEQWDWLAQQFAVKADVRIVGSPTQFGHTYNGYESWANFPIEQNKLLHLLDGSTATHTLVISGDVHYAEISKIESPQGNFFYDITSSGLSSSWDFATPNANRIAGPVMQNHFGLLTFQLSKKQLSIKSAIVDVKGNKVLEIDVTH